MMCLTQQTLTSLIWETSSRETYHLEIVAALEVSVTILAVVMALLVHMLIAIILVAEDGVASLAWKLRLPM